MPIIDRIESARRELLDLTTRSRLLHTPRGASVKIVEVADERSEQIYRILVQDGKRMSFLPRPEPEGGLEADDPYMQMELLAPEDDDSDEETVASRHVDTRLQTKLLSPKLQKRLLQLYYDARNFEEEQGVNILYLALGFLKWFEAGSSDRPRYAPLILVPVVLDRRSAQSRFQLSYSEEELSTNLSLQAKLKHDFGIALPDLPDAEELSPSAYYDAVAKAVSAQPRWEVLRDDVVLGFFSFAKFLMYRDLDPRNWPQRRKLEAHPLISGLLGDGFKHDPSPFGEDTNVDELLDPRDMVHIVDADSSQTLAIEEVRRGRDLVIQGPPGTGKSQTIANLIAIAVREGKTVLFMAEKMAALEVVQRRLDTIGLGVMCLELHSHKARKKAVLEELERTLNLGRPQMDGIETLTRQLRERRAELNGHVRRLHTPLEASGFTPYQIAGQLVRLSANGIQPQDYKLSQARVWSRDDLRERETQIRRLAQHIEEIGTPGEHPWRGARLDVVLPQDVARLEPRIRPLHTPLSEWRESVSDLAHCLDGRGDTWREVAALLGLADAIARSPSMDRASIASPVWEERRGLISELVEALRLLVEARTKLEDILVPEAWDADLGPVRRALKAHGTSLLRFFNREWRQARATLHGYLKGDLPKSLSDQLSILDTLSGGQEAREKLRELDAVGHEAFGSRWSGEASDSEALAAIERWEQECRTAGLPGNFRAVVARLDDPAEIEARTRSIREQAVTLRLELGKCFDEVRLDLVEAFGDSDLNDIPLGEVVQRLGDWVSAPSGLQQWITFRVWAAEARDRDLGEVVDRLYDGRIAPAVAVESFRYAFFEELMREVFERHPALATFSGSSHERLIEDFRELDQARIRLARQEVAAMHHAGLPAGSGEIGELGILRREIRKQRRHLPLRQLMKQAGQAIQTIKPVFMMSPMSIAQYLEPGILEFDLLLIDEASQVQPMDALGAIARSKQIVVVGDERQLPPTRFFTKVLGDDWNEDDPELFAAGDLESILGLCIAQGLSDRLLRWHYRSRHESLIAVSNREFYNSRLFVVPSAQRDGGLGLRFHLISGAVYDRGGSATNRVEARAVAAAVIEHAHTAPSLTLGVGTFSVSQRDAILDELELLRRKHPETERFFGPSGPEPFFVKNLESIQGDERDVIFISVGYGRDASGYMAMNFGPLSAEGGERRLNVLITRARQRCEVFSSITAADIDLNRTQSVGVRAFQTFLHYAESGDLGVPRSTGKDPDSPFEEEVARALKQLGFGVEHQIGIAGFFVDLAIRDPEHPGRYLLGVECDGATYHSSRSARDRDRLRQQVLEDRGWIIHRIWSTDWYHRPDGELRKAVAAIEGAKRRAQNPATNLPSLRAPAKSIASEPAIPRSDPEEPKGKETAADIGIPYREASFHVRSPVELHEAPLDQLVTNILKIVEVEGPIHGEEIARRLTTIWGKGRAGQRIQQAVQTALRRAVSKKQLVKDGAFYAMKPLDAVPPRSRADVQSPTLRKPKLLPPVEIRTALRMIVSDHVGVTPDEAVVQVARMLGFNRTGAELKDTIENQLNRMLSRGALKLKDGKLYRE